MKEESGNNRPVKLVSISGKVIEEITTKSNMRFSGTGVLRRALDAKPAFKLHQGVMHYPVLQTWRQLGCIPGGQGNAFSRQISKARLS